VTSKVLGYAWITSTRVSTLQTPHKQGFEELEKQNNRVHSQLRYYFWDKGLKDYVVLDLNVYYDFLIFDQQILNK
jgi:hypothetical protein